ALSYSETSLDVYLPFLYKTLGLDIPYQLFGIFVAIQPKYLTEHYYLPSDS
ncbi:unnamed protein product, partial [Dicrocoelium dendriticum]